MNKKISLLSIIIGSFLLSACDTPLPQCESSDSIDLFTQIMSNSLKENQVDAKIVEIKDPKEVGFNKKDEFRVCKANVIFSDGSSENITYNVYWKNKNKKDYFYVEIPEQ